MLVALVLALSRLQAGEDFAAWSIGGVGVSGIAAEVQAPGVAPDPHFKRNDLYHVIQFAGRIGRTAPGCRGTGTQPALKPARGGRESLLMLQW